MRIRPFQAGDEIAQAAIYNQAAEALPSFKPASREDVERRTKAPDFDPRARLYAEADGKVVGYIAFQWNGRISHPWCLPGQEAAADSLFQEALTQMRAQGIPNALAAYRNDWSSVKDFFASHGFTQAREVINFVLDQVDMPTRPGSRRNPLTPLRPTDIPAILKMGRGLLRIGNAERLEQYLFHNPGFGPDALFVLRSRTDDLPMAVGILVANADYADPHQIDANMPCYRLGAFGSEGMTTKRVNGLFSFLSYNEREAVPMALDLLGHASLQSEDVTGGTLAAQIASDVPYLLRFYQRYFRRQGSFAVFERSLAQ